MNQIAMTCIKIWREYNTDKIQIDVSCISDWWIAEFLLDSYDLLKFIF